MILHLVVDIYSYRKPLKKGLDGYCFHWPELQRINCVFLQTFSWDWKGPFIMVSCSFLKYFLATFSLYLLLSVLKHSWVCQGEKFSSLVPKVRKFTQVTAQARRLITVKDLISLR